MVKHPSATIIVFLTSAGCPAIDPILTAALLNIFAHSRDPQSVELQSEPIEHPEQPCWLSVIVAVDIIVIVYGVRESGCRRRSWKHERRICIPNASTDGATTSRAVASCKC